MIPVLDPRIIMCFGFCSFIPDSSQFSLNLYSRNNPYAGFVEFYPDISLIMKHLGVYVSMDAFNGRSRLLNSEDWNPYREYHLEIVDWSEEPVISKYPLFETLQYRAFGWFSYEDFTVKVGRDFLRISRSLRYPLLFSGYGYPLDWYYLLEGRYKFIKGYTGFSRVPSRYENKRLSFQRMEINLGFLNIGLTEMVIYTRDDTWKYANPFVLYYVVQRRESDNDDNLFLHIDASLNIFGFEIYGEFMGDDPSVFYGEGQAPLMGFTSGLRFEKDKNFFNVEGSLVLPFTYAHFTQKNTFDALGLPMATYLGQDYMAVYAFYSYGSLFLDAEYIEHGRVPFGLPFELSGMPPTDAFPRRPLSKWYRFGLGVNRLERDLGFALVRLAGRLGFDIVDGKLKPSWSFLWFIRTRWGL